jgi:hypothetical protein
LAEIAALVQSWNEKAATPEINQRKKVDKKERRLTKIQSMHDRHEGTDILNLIKAKLGYFNIQLDQLNDNFGLNLVLLYSQTKTIELRTQYDDNVVIFIIKDTGIGIDYLSQDKIF